MGMSSFSTLLLVMCCFLKHRGVFPIKVEQVTQNISLIGESGVWDSCLQSELWVDIPGGVVHRLYPNLLQETSIKAETAVSFAVPRCNGQGMVIAQRNRLDFLGHNGVQVPFLSKEALGMEEGYSTNDGKADAMGRLWFGINPPLDGPLTNLTPTAGLLSVTGDGIVKQHLSNLTIANGMDWSVDGKTFLLVDTLRAIVWAFDFDLARGEIGNQRPLITFPGGPLVDVPDGLTIDADNNVWVALYNSAAVAKFDIKTGTELQRIDLSPITIITCPNFGGRNLDELYVTTGSRGPTQQPLENQPGAGALFKVTGLGVKGRIPNSFSG